MVLGLRRLPRFMLALSLLGLLLGTLPAPAVSAATTYTVNVLTDTGAGSGTTGDLRYAITQVNAGSGGDTINITATGTITLTGGTLMLNKDVMITGPGANVLAIDGGCTGCDPGGTPSGGVQVFAVGTVAATISGLTIQHGNGGAGFGGGIINQFGGTLTLRADLLTGNVAAYGGGIYNNFATLIVDRTTVEGNTADQGAINNNNSGILTVTNSTFANNQSQAGGAILNFNQASVTNTTISGNGAPGFGGGGIYNGSGTLTLTGSIVAGNSGAPGLDVYAYIAVTDGGYNVIGSPANNAFVDGTNHDRVGTAATPLDPKLTALGNFGGTTAIFALLPGSPAIDLIPAATLGCGTTLVSDQRGITRPQPSGGACDSGSFEARYSLVITGVNPQSATVGQPFPSPLAVTLSSGDGVTALSGGIVTFTPPASGASATVVGSPATTNASGQASVTATANLIAGAYSVTASAPGAAAAMFTLTNTAPTITLSPMTVPNGAAEQVYPATTLVASGTGSTAPYTFAVTTGVLPSGLTLTPAGVLSGTPTQAGSFPFTVTATDANLFTGAQSYTLTITAPTVVVAPASLPGGVKGVAYPATTITASGGVAPYTFTVTTGVLPGGLTLNPTTGILSGTPTATGTFPFTVTATDANTFTGTQAYTIMVTAAPLVSIAIAPNPATVKVGQMQQFTATGTYADSSTADLTSQVIWSSDAPTMASVDASGKVTGKAAGVAHITATQGAISGQATVTVSPPVLTGVQPAPAPANRPGAASVPTGPASAPPPAPAPPSR